MRAKYKISLTKWVENELQTGDRVLYMTGGTK
jgi:hypothetical protein